ncbi:MAG: tyrosine-type recombinase/integrase [Enterocloster clostridioformis]
MSPAGKRSYAMVLLAARLGLRIGDIRNLKLHDIDWTKKQISIIRHKTQKALLLPLPEEVGWAVIDYLKNVVLVYKCGQKKLNDLYYEMKEQRRCSTWRKIKNRILRNLSSRSSSCIMPEEPRIHNWNVNMA